MLPPGEYDFEVLKSTDKFSKGGNPMIELVMWVYSADGERVIVTDYLLEKLAYKLRHFASAVGRIADYEAGTLDGNGLVGLTGRCKLGVEKPKDDSPYPPKNVVRDYVVPKAGSNGGGAAPEQEEAAASGNQDGMPF